MCVTNSRVPSGLGSGLKLERSGGRGGSMVRGEVGVVGIYGVMGHRSIAASWWANGGASRASLRMFGGVRFFWPI